MTPPNETSRCIQYEFFQKESAIASFLSGQGFYRVMPLQVAQSFKNQLLKGGDSIIAYELSQVQTLDQLRMQIHRVVLLTRKQKKYLPIQVTGINVSGP